MSQLVFAIVANAKANAGRNRGEPMTAENVDELDANRSADAKRG